MADLYRALVTLKVTSDPDPKNWTTNSLYFSRAIPFGGVADYNALATDLAAIYSARTLILGGPIAPEVRIYNMQDDQPRPVRGQATGTTIATATFGPHELALCLSFYAGRNLPSQRGRIYLGPLKSTLTGSERPGTSWMDDLLNMADSLSGLGGVDVDWVVFSPTLSQRNGWNPQTGDGPMTYNKVTNAWVDNDWDVQRRRGFKTGNTRRTRAVSG